MTAVDGANAGPAGPGTVPDAVLRAGPVTGPDVRPEAGPADGPDGPVPVVLAGGRGHGSWHLENLRRLSEAGRVRLAGVCELQPLAAEELAGFDGVEQSPDLAGLLERTGARITVVCTPIHTHTELALTAARVGSHLLLEKPPTPSYEDFRRLTEGLAAAGTACQIGFQSLGSHALDAIAGLIGGGAVGRVRGIGGAGAWVRGEDYYTRAPWAGRRTLGGRDVVDGVLTNPLAHAVATALRIDGSDRAEDLAGIELEQYRAHEIEADDTSCLRLTTARGTRITVAVTLCAERTADPYLLVHGDRGRITFWYTRDRVLVQRAGHAPEERLYGRTDLLEDLLAHLATGSPLLVPAHRTGAFTRVVEAVRTAPPPVRLTEPVWHRADGPAWRSGGTAPRRVISGVDELVAASAETLSLFSELGADWAVPAGVPGGEEERRP
ncbi:Gfo/Idh/MocA family oxidoreductase [Streptomyces sp. WAC 00631]|uniref:Gfo/Idh/MocA family protein n=1 Tax=Streptomyces sp. WAC 00631 TaxID=2203201 RepID=UPI000F766529|nr:Gfo/Idh/MocA family oxidoreductase [Streptomyces sp. WAC 00631]MCC5034396.1 Gfo/Idh/MocA family oxidoreductase [Streptomyces sp. WAC 00631]